MKQVLTVLVISFYDAFLTINNIYTFRQMVIKCAYLSSLKIENHILCTIHIGAYILNGSGRINLCHIGSCNTQVIVAIGCDTKVGHLLAIVPVVEDEAVGPTIGIE